MEFVKSETSKWLKKAEEDLDTAELCMNNGRFEAAAFFSQQAAEKALKAVLLERGNELIKVHDLVLLAREVNAPEKILEHAKELTLAYIYSRYPDIPEIKDMDAKSKKFMNYATEAVKWAKEQLS